MQLAWPRLQLMLRCKRHGKHVKHLMKLHNKQKMKKLLTWTKNYMFIHRSATVVIKERIFKLPSKLKMTPVLTNGIFKAIACMNKNSLKTFTSLCCTVKQSVITARSWVGKANEWPMSDKVSKDNFWIKAACQCATQIWSFSSHHRSLQCPFRQVSSIYTWATVFTGLH